MKHLRPSHLFLAAALAAAAVPSMAQQPASPRDPYTEGARAGDKFDPYTQGTNESTRQDLAPAPAPEVQPSTVPAQPGPGSEMQRHPDSYTDEARWHGPNLGQRLGPRNPFLDGS